MIRLHTFGGVVLYGDDGARLHGAASQRRILGLLSVLGASGERGLTRDKIVGVLWPEVSPARARHSLTQTMYAARKALGCDDLFEATEDIRLNPTRIHSDVAEFEALMRDGDDAAAVALYRGPFLDGFYFASNEFDWWLQSQRGRLEGEAVTALERLVGKAEEGGEWGQAATYLRRLTAIRPTDATAAIRLMKALAAAGDRAGAIQHAAVHERLLREQFELEPETEVVSLAAELRKGARPHGSYVRTLLRAVLGDRIAPATDVTPPQAAGGNSTKGVESTALSPRDGSAGAAVENESPGRGGRRYAMLTGILWQRRVLVSAAAVVMLVGAVIAVRLTTGPAAPVPNPVLEQRVVVMPFRVAGADPALAYLREGMVEMLSTRLADDTAARSVDTGAVLAAWRKAGIARVSELPRDSLVRLARGLGARRVVVGSVIGSPARMVLNATVLALPAGQVAGEASVEGSANQLVQLVDQLAAKLLLVEAGQSDRLADRMTHSLPALRAYLAGVAADAQGDHAVAARAYGRALQQDTAFALSALHLGLAARKLNAFDLEREALHDAWRFRAQLSDRDEAELFALLGPRYPRPSTAGQALTAWQTAARLAPQRSEVWLGWAQRILADGAVAGLGNVPERASSALQRAAALNPSDPLARVLLAGARRGGQGSAGVEEKSDTLRPAYELFLRWWAAAQSADTTDLTAVQDSLPQAGPGNLREIAAASAFSGIRPADGARALEILAGRAADADEALGILLAQHGLALERGRPARALQLTQDMARLGPIGRPHLRLRVLDAVFAEGDRAAAAAAAQELQRTAANPDLANASADACALAQWQLAGADTLGATATLALLQRAPADAPPASVGGPAPVCAQLVEAALAVEAGRADARARVDRVDSLVLTSVSAGDVAAYAPIVISRLYRRLGDPVRALAAVRRRPNMAAIWPRYLATELKQEAELARETGDLSGAASAYRSYLSLRDDPEPELRAEVRQVRAMAASLTPG